MCSGRYANDSSTGRVEAWETGAARECGRSTCLECYHMGHTIISIDALLAPFSAGLSAGSRVVGTGSRCARARAAVIVSRVQPRALFFSLRGPKHHARPIRFPLRASHALVIARAYAARFLLRRRSAAALLRADRRA